MPVGVGRVDGGGAGIVSSHVGLFGGGCCHARSPGASPSDAKVVHCGHVVGVHTGSSWLEWVSMCRLARCAAIRST